MRIVSSSSTILGFSLILLLGSAAPSMAKPGGGNLTTCTSPNGTFNVTSYIFNSTPTPFQLQNDGNSQYLTRQNSRFDFVHSQIQGNTCDWVLDLRTSKSRTIQLSLDFPVSLGEQLPNPWPGGLVSLPALVMTNCAANPQNAISVGNMTYAGQTLQCGMHVTFYAGGTQYSVRMNPNTWPGATWGQVTCTNAASNLCDAWTLAPGVDVSGSYETDPYTQQTSGIGELVLPSCDGCAGGTPLGLYYVSFSGMVTKP